MGNRQADKKQKDVNREYAYDDAEDRMNEYPCGIGKTKPEGELKQTPTDEQRAVCPLVRNIQFLKDIRGRVPHRA